MTAKRGDHPASPQSIAQSVDGGIHLSSEYGWEGMTIREQFAMAAMQGLLSSSGNENRNSLTNGEVVANSVMFADALLAELERTK